MLKSTKPPGTDGPATCCGDWKNAVEDLGGRAQEFARKEPAQAVGIAFLAGLVLTLLPVGRIVSKKRVQDLLRETDNAIRANPIPAVLTALGVGFALGLATRLLEIPERKPELLRDALDDLRALLSTSAKRGQRAYADSAEAVRDAVEQAVESARELDIDPVAKWWQRLRS